MELMAGEARYSRLLRKISVLQLPRAVCINRCDQVANARLKMHCMTAQAIVDQLLLLILRGVQEDVGICRAVPARSPRREFLLMATLAAYSHREHVSVLELRLLRRVAAQVRDDPAYVLQVEPCVQRKHITMAARARDVAMCRGVPVCIGLPDLVTTGTGTAGALVVDGWSGEGDDDNRENGRCSREPTFEEESTNPAALYRPGN